MRVEHEGGGGQRRLEGSVGHRSQGQELEPGACLGGDSEDVVAVAGDALVAGHKASAVRGHQSRQAGQQTRRACLDSLGEVRGEHGQVKRINVGLEARHDRL